MDKSFVSVTQAFVKLLLALALIGLAISSSGFSPASATPSLSTTANPQIEIRMVPGTVNVSKDVEEAVRQALSGTPDVLLTSDYYSISDVRIEEPWYFVSVVGLKGLGADLKWTLPSNANWFGLVLLQSGDGSHWIGAVEGTKQFSQLLNQVPERILGATAKRDLDPLQRASIAATSNYIFPWQPSTSMQYGQLGVHDNGFSSLVSGWKAVDILSDGDTSLGHAPNSLLASAAGTISYKCTPNSGDQTTAIRIGDLMYTHLLNSSNLYTGKSFSQGDEIGQLKSGTFNEACGYASQLAQWFHVHLGFPNSGAVTFEDWTLNISDGLWRRGSESPRGTYSWFEARGNASATLTIMLGISLRNRDVTIELRRISGFGQLLPPIPLFTGRTDVAGNATVTLSGVAPGTYNLLVKPRSYLRKQKSSVQISEGVNTLDLRALCSGGWSNCGGDIIGDNKVNELDLYQMATDWSKTDPVALERSDLTGDGSVDAYDLMVLTNAWGVKGDGEESSSLNLDFQSTTLALGELSLTLAPTSNQSYKAGLDAKTSSVGDIVTVTLGFDTAGLPMFGTDLTIDYDHCALEPLVDFTIDSGIFSRTGTISKTGTLEYYADKWLSEATLPVSGTGHLAHIPFRVLAGTPASTTVAIRFGFGDTSDSNMVQYGVVQDFLGRVANIVLYPTGVPQRPSRTALITSPLSGTIINQSAILLEAQASDPCNGIRQAIFSVFYDGQWHQVGTDSDGTDGWSVYWDASQVSDQSIKVKAFAGDMAGNGIEAEVNDNILLDREPASVIGLTFTPATIEPGKPVTIGVSAADNLAGVKRVDIYVDPSTDNSASWDLWNLVGSVTDTSGNIIWNTTGYTPGPHQLILILEDMGENRTFWPLPGDTPIKYNLSHQIYLPIVLRIS